MSNHLVCLPKEIEKDVLFWLRKHKLENGETCEELSVERVDKDKDADENVDADQTSTVRPVSGQSIGLFTQHEEIDIDFRVSGFPHAVVKQAEKLPCSRTREEDRESPSSTSSPSRSATK